ncbi:MAG: Ger(x)C family spore germination protein, partial [Bacillota bacterium]|nr:Ger(x)C family spore germination protein [Bacillota bacterium]
MKKILAIILCLIVLTCCGCWDKVEIDRNAFVSSIGIDAGKDIKNKKEEQQAKPDEPFAERELEKLDVTYAFPDISKYSAQNTQIPSDKQVKAKGYSLEDAMTKAAAKTSRVLDLGHAQLLILSQDLLQYEETLSQIMDYLARNPRLNRNMYVMVCEGTIDEFFNFKLGMENTLGAYITGLMENSKRNASIIPVKLSEFFILLSQNGNAIVPAIKIDKEMNEMVIDGIAIIKQYKMVGLLS